MHFTSDIIIIIFLKCGLKYTHTTFERQVLKIIEMNSFRKKSVKKNINSLWLGHFALLFNAQSKIYNTYEYGLHKTFARIC